MPKKFPINNLPMADVTTFFRLLQEGVKDLCDYDLERRRIQAARDTCLREIELRHETYRQIFDYLFAERRQAIDGYFQLIEQSWATKDDDLLLLAMRGLSDLVTTSPFQDLERLQAALEGDEIIEI